MAEQAAYDRNLFQSTPANMMVELKFPEYVLASQTKLLRIYLNAGGADG